MPIRTEELMIDIETYGQKPGCQVLSIGWCTFVGYREVFAPVGENGNETTYAPVRQEPMILAHGQFALDLDEQAAAGLHVDPDTVKWWEDQPDAMAALRELQATGAHKAAIALALLKRLTENKVAFWANGPEFDFVILEAYLRATIGERLPFPFWAWRQCRATGDDAELVSGKSMDVLRVRPEIAHDAGHDCVAQAKWMLNCRAAMLGLPLPY